MRTKLLILCVAMSSTLFAQLPNSLIAPLTETENYEDYKGSIFTTSNFQDASVIHEKSGTFDAKLRYNILNDAIEFESKSGIVEITKDPTVHTRIDNDYFYYCNFKNELGVNNSGYFVLVELTDRYRIYKKHALRFQEPQESTLTTEKVKGRITVLTTYYLEESGVIVKLPKNKRSMLATFSDKEDELKQYIKKAKIRLGKEEDLIRFIARYNALKSSDSVPTSLIGNSRN